MAKLSLIQTNFTAGELSPRLMGRVDIARYQNGAKRLENALVAVQGGVMRTWGTEFISEVKDSTKQTRLIPYVFNRDQAYMVEFGDKYIRVFKDTVQMTELISPYTEAMLTRINYVQGADTMFLAHQALPIHRLRRISDKEWTLGEAPFIVKPFDEVGDKPAVKLTLSKTAITAKGETVLPTASLEEDWFWPADVGRNIICGTGVAEITAYTNRRLVTLKITSAFTEATLKVKDWLIEASPQAKCTPSAKDPVGQEISLTLDKDGWRAEDVGKYVRLNKGLCLITKFNNSKLVQAEIKTVLSAVAAVTANAWSLETVIWNDDYGYPAAVTLHNQRLFCGGSFEKPQTIWMSKTAEYLNFELSTEDDNAASFTISSDQINPIVHLTQLDNPVVLSYGGEFSLTGSASKSAITPTNINIKNHSAYGCNSVKPIRIGNQLFFIQRSGRKLRSTAYDSASDVMIATDASVLSEHITAGGIVDMAYQQEPESILWLVRADGQIATLTVDASQEVLAWARQFTDGKFESIATIPNGVADEIWVIVNRQINGKTVRYIERFNSHIYSHCCKQFTSEDGQQTFTGQLLLQRTITLTRETDYQENGDLLANTLNQDFDRLYLAMQGFAQDNGQALRVTDADGIQPLPLAEQRANKTLSFDNQGKPLLTTTATGTATATELAQQLADNSDPHKGASLISYNKALDYTTQTIGNAINTLTDRFDNFEGNGVPPFTVLWWPSRASIPAGYVAADGQQLPQTTFPDIATAIQAGQVPTVQETEWQTDPLKRGHYVAHSTDGYFRLPDYNGRYADSIGALFLRGDNGMVTNGVIQRDALQNITGVMGLSRSISDNTTSGAFYTESSIINAPGSGSIAASIFNFKFDASRVARTAEETRPVNISGCWIIKLFGAVTNQSQADIQQLVTDYANLAAKFSELESYQQAKKFTIIYPNDGTKETPANVELNKRYVINNPFVGVSIQVVAEIYYNNIWADTGFIYAGSGGYGVKATYISETDQIVIQTGDIALLTSSKNTGGGHGVVGINVSTAQPCRVKVWRAI